MFGYNYLQFLQILKSYLKQTGTLPLIPPLVCHKKVLKFKSQSALDSRLRFHFFQELQLVGRVFSWNGKLLFTFSIDFRLTLSFLSQFFADFSFNLLKRSLLDLLWINVLSGTFAPNVPGDARLIYPSFNQTFWSSVFWFNFPLSIEKHMTSTGLQS